MKNRMLAAGIAATTAIWLVGSSLVPLAGAATVEELQAQITSLLAQITALQGQLAGGSTAGGCYTFTRSLTVGMSGADVTALQNYLSPTYFTSAATGYFGPITQAAVAAWQTAKGVAPAAGYWGSLSQAKYNTVCTPAEDGTGAVSGVEGALTDFDAIASLSNEEVGEDEADVEVLGVDFEADGADQTIERVNVIVDNPTGVSQKLGDYITDVSVWLDGKKLDSMDVSDASYDRAADEYTFRFVGLKGVVKDGAKAELTLAVSGVSNLDTDDIDGTWDISIPNDGIRAASPNGATDTYVSVDDTGYVETFSLTTFATSHDVELTVKRSSDTPEDQIVIGDDNSEFDADLLAFTMKAEGSDITIYTLPVTLTAGIGDEVDLVDSLTLNCDGTDWSENVAAAAVDFEDMELDIAEGDTAECTLTATMNEIGGDFVSGDSLTADVEVADIDAEDQTGEAVETLTGSANGLEQTFINEGLALSSVVAKAVVYSDVPEGGGAAVGKFTVEFDATAEGAPVWIPMDANPEYTVASAGGEGEDIVSAVFECVADCGSAADNSDTDFFIDEGDTETYRLTVYLSSAGDSDNFKIWLDTVFWDLADGVGGEEYTTGLGEGTSADTGNLFLEVVTP